jgi:aerobic carbon-monoxide dehydrogenase medium subunit
MYPAPLEYHRAESVEDALALLSRFGEDAKLIAGGHSLLPLMKLRFVQPAHVIDVRRIPALADVRDDGSAIAIGAATTHAAVASSPRVRSALPALADAASIIGDPLVRNMGTIGGSLAHADPSADLPAVMLAYGAEMVVRSSGGSRTIAADDFFVDVFTSALATGEMLVEIRVPVPPPGTGSAYVKLPDPASGYAVCGVAAVLQTADGKITSARVGLTGLASHAGRLPQVEQALAGQTAGDAAARSAAAHAADGSSFVDDPRSSAAYKANLARVYTERAIKRALGRT